MVRGGGFDMQIMLQSPLNGGLSTMDSLSALRSGPSHLQMQARSCRMWRPAAMPWIRPRSSHPRQPSLTPRLCPPQTTGRQRVWARPSFILPPQHARRPEQPPTQRSPGSRPPPPPRQRPRARLPKRHMTAWRCPPLPPTPTCPHQPRPGNAAPWWPVCRGQPPPPPLPLQRAAPPGTLAAARMPARRPRQGSTWPLSWRRWPPACIVAPAPAPDP